MAHDGDQPNGREADGIGDHSTERPGGSVGGVLGAVGHWYRRGLYGFTLRVSALTAVLGRALLAGGFAAARDTFEDVRDYADHNIADEDSCSAYAENAMPELARVLLVMTPLLLVLALLVLSVLHTAYAPERVCPPPSWSTR
ncbi:hypothetical protein [Streptomyces sp. NPDC050264]|uniref:hypothetical protein n=1 Tax=Streptomyces sp. NPDC050264 TaxID=3155038 RepID=UPI00344A3B24